MKKIKVMKVELKALAEEICLSRKAFKDGHRAVSAYDVTHPDWKKDWRSQVYKDRYAVLYKTPVNPMYQSYQYRLKHMAYCLLRGRTQEQVEPFVKEGNELDMPEVEKIMEAYREEAVCADSLGSVA